MAVNVIVIAVTLMMGGFVAVWLVCPRCRPWFEAPKWQPLGWDPPPRTISPQFSALAGDRGRLVDSGHVSFGEVKNPSAVLQLRGDREMDQVHDQTGTVTGETWISGDES
jgi:hypothetical protein